MVFSADKNNNNNPTRPLMRAFYCPKMALVHATTATIMPRWLKFILVFLLALLLSLAAIWLFVRLQGIQYLAAYTGGGFAKPLPETVYPPPSDNWRQACASGPIKVLSFNVLYGSAFIEDMAARFRNGDTGGFLPWSARVPEIRTRIADYDADLIGLQETHTDADIAMIVPPKKYSLVNYHLGSFQYGDAALLFRTERFQLLDSGQLWLGPTPELPLALGFRALSVIRYVNWALLKEKATGFTFLFVNTHFDNAGGNKEPSSALFRERITRLARNLPVIVTGDFNSKATTERYRIFTGSDQTPPLLTNAYTLAHQPPVPTQEHPDNRIDHILVGGPCTVTATGWHIDRKPMANGAPLSDHDPVLVNLRFTAN